jgi:hypothetical protein
MDAEELLTTSPTAQAVAEEVARLPPPPPEKLEALRRTLENARNAEPSSLEREWPPVLQTPRSKKDSRYAEPPTSHRAGLMGPLLVFAKRTFRLGFQPFINEMLRKQVEFNEAILDALATVYEHQQLQARTQAQWRKEVAERLARLERQAPAGSEREGAGKPR